MEASRLATNLEVGIWKWAIDKLRRAKVGMRNWEKTNVVLKTIIRKLESEYNRSGIGLGAWGMARGVE